MAGGAGVGGFRPGAAVGAVVAVVGAVVAGADPAEAVAITGEACAPDGAVVTMPVATVLFGYGWQVRLRLLPETFRVSDTAGSTVREMAPPDALKGPTVPGVEGSVRPRPVAGTGLGMGVLMVMVPLEIEAGVAPVASIFSEAVPLMEEFPRAAAAVTIWVGRLTIDW